MIDQAKAFELIEKAQKYKKNRYTYLDKICTASESSKWVNLYIDKNSLILKSDKNVIYTENENVATIESKQIKTVDELLSIAKVDLNIWSVDHFIVNKWANASKDKSEEIIVTDLFQVKVWLKKKVAADTTKELIEWFKTEVANFAPKNKWNDIKLIKNNKKYCLELAVPDLHLGKMAWSLETLGENYDSNEAVLIYEKAIIDLISKAPMDQVNHILLPVGSDFYNSDNARDETTAGTYVGSDNRWQKVFRKGTELLIKIITKLAQTHKITIPIVQGNHDWEKSFYLGEVLAATFKNHPNVIINNSPAPRKYFRFGANLIGFTHGSEEKISNLPLILATECKNDWSETKFREIHVGHMHKESNNEYQGIKVRFLPSLCSADSWHSKKGYVGTIRSAIGFLWDFDKGLEAQLYFNV